MADNDILARLSSFIDYESPELAEFLYGMWGDQANAITYHELRDAIMDGSLSLDYLRQWQQDYSRFITEAYAPRVDRAVAQAAADLRREYGVDFHDPMFSKVDSFIQTNGGQLIRQVSVEQYQAVNALVRQAALTNTLTVDQAARAIRPCVGLTRRQAQTTKRFYDNLIEEGYSHKRAHERQLAYAAKIHRRRAALIAQTEMARAYSYGWHATIQQNVEDGILPPGTRKVWLTAEDEKVCPECGKMNGESVLWNEPFSNGSLYPPAHPNCRCHHKIDFVDLLPQAQIHAEEPPRQQAQIPAYVEDYTEGELTEAHARVVEAPAGATERYTVHAAETPTDGTGSIIELLPGGGTSAAAQIPERGLLSSTDDGIMKPEDAIPSNWNEIMARNATTIQHGFSAYPDGDLLAVYTLSTKPEKGFYDVAMHGSPTAVGFSSKDANMTARELATFIQHRDDYHGENIRLLSCSTGAELKDDMCFAEELANAMGKKVKAPTDDLFFYQDGTFKIGVLDTGRFRTIKPNQRRRLK